MAVLGRAAPSRASTADLVAELWAALSPAERARAAESIGGVTTWPPQRHGVDALIALLEGEPARAFDELQASVGAEAAARIWSAELLSWCAFALPR